MAATFKVRADAMKRTVALKDYIGVTGMYDDAYSQLDGGRDALAPPAYTFEPLDAAKASKSAEVSPSRAAVDPWGDGSSKKIIDTDGTRSVGIDEMIAAKMS